MNRNRRIASIEASAECARDMGVDTSRLDFAIRAWYANLEAVQYYAEESAKVADAVDAMDAQIAALIKRRDNMQKNLDGMDNARGECLGMCDELMRNVIKEYTAEIRNASIAASAQYIDDGSAAWDEHAAQKQKHAERRKKTECKKTATAKTATDLYLPHCREFEHAHETTEERVNCIRKDVVRGDHMSGAYSHDVSNYRASEAGKKRVIRDLEIKNDNHAWDGSDSEIENQNGSYAEALSDISSRLKSINMHTPFDEWKRVIDGCRKERVEWSRVTRE